MGNKNYEDNKSFWWSMLLEFGEDVLATKRKKTGQTQADIAIKTGLNQSEISRIESGFTKPRDLPTIDAICQAYQLSNSEKAKYIELTTGYTSQNIGESEEIINNLLEGQIPFIAHTNRSGSPRIAIEQAELIMNWIESQNISLDKYGQNTLNKISYLLLEESAAWWDTTTTQLIDGRTAGLLNKMQQLTTISPRNNAITTLYFDINRGFHEYIKQDYVNATKTFNRVSNSPSFTGNPWELEVLRAGTIALGKTNNFRALKYNENNVLNKISSGNLTPQNKGYLLEGLGRAYLAFDISQSKRYLEESYRWIELARGMPDFLNVRFVQSVRSNLLMMKRANTHTREMLTFAEPALIETEKSGLVRHKNQILEIINSAA